jgi:hypothetical protein
MRKERLAAIEKVRASLVAGERDLDAAIASGSLLSHAFITACTEANLSIMIGQEGFDEIAEGNRHLAMARASFVRAHKALREAPAQMGLPEISFGDTRPCPSFTTPSGLRSVG